MPYKNKTYICFDGDTDMQYYRLMQAWSENDNFSFEFYNAHDLNSARDTSTEESIKKQLRIRLANSKLLIVLIGEKTAGLRKFVPWEMEVALKMEMPIIGVNLNGNRKKDQRCPPTIRDKLAIFVPFSARIIEYAMNNWPKSHQNHRKSQKSNSFYYTEEIYKSLGI